MKIKIRFRGITPGNLGGDPLMDPLKSKKGIVLYSPAFFLMPEENQKHMLYLQFDNWLHKTGWFHPDYEVKK
jgi:hypothetical protein